MLRILRSTITVAASASNATVNADITQADLEAAVPVGGAITPLAFVLDPEDADVTISSLVIGNTKNEEGKVNMVPLGTALSLAALNKVLSMESGGVDAPRLSVAHGARLTAVVSNAVASIKTISVLWKVENEHDLTPHGPDFGLTFRNQPFAGGEVFDSARSAAAALAAEKRSGDSFRGTRLTPLF